MNWYIVQAYSGFEKKVVESIKDTLTKSKLEANLGEILVPTQEVTEVKKGKRLERHVYIEKGRSRQNIHAHFFTKGSTLKETKSIIYNAQHIWQTVDKASDIEVSLIENNDGIKGYCTKELDTVDTDILLTDCTH